VVQRRLLGSIMQFSTMNNPQLLKILANYWQWRTLWLSTTVIFASLALFYVLLIKGDTWVASQAIIVRDEANGAVMRLGRFESQTEMKAAQETILEMAHNTQVLGDALKAVGPERSWRVWLMGDRPPTASEIDDLARNGIVVRAPRGAELGTTEVIYLDVKQNSPERAVKLTRAVCEALEHRMQKVRQSRADGVITELLTAKQTVQQQLRQATEQLTQMETEAGTDLSDLRGMTDTGGGGSSSRIVLDSIKAEIRQAEAQLQQLSTDLQLAIESCDNPDHLLLTPGSLFNSQPGLKAIRDGLAAATINTSQVRGRYTTQHPLVQAALQSESNLREQLRNELQLAVQTLSKDSTIAADRIEKLNSQRLQLEARLAKIANIRAEYANVANEVRARSQQLQDCERDLAQAQASREAAMTSSLMTRLDQPLIGEKPVGPGRSTIVMGASLSGLFFGLGLVFLLSPLDGGVNFGRRRFDYSGQAGRRASDRLRETTDAISSTLVIPTDPTVPMPRRAADRRADQAVATNPPTANDAPEWAHPLQLTGKLGQIVHAWRVSQQPIQPPPKTTAPSSNNILASQSTLVADTQVLSRAAKPTATALAPSQSAVSTFSAEASMPPRPTQV